jgi:hypothetical protein
MDGALQTFPIAMRLFHQPKRTPKPAS